MEQTRALNALEQFLALTKSASSPRAAAEIIERATSHPNTYIFTELLVTPQIQSLQSTPEYAPHYQLLQIFSYGTYADYKSVPNLPTLNDQQLLKLRQLSLLTLARDPKNLSYSNLIAQLGLDDARALENLVISAIYAGLLSGQLDPANARVATSSVSPLRDLSPNSLPALHATLKAWSARCGETLAKLEEELAMNKRQIREHNIEKTKHDKHFEELLDAYSRTNGATDSGSAAGTRSKASLMSSVAQFGSKRGSQEAMMGGMDDMDVDIEEQDMRKGNKMPKMKGR